MSEDRDESPVDPPQEWLDDLAASEADLAAGRVIDGGIVMRRLCETIARMEAAQDGRAEAGSLPPR